jgi:hypothetical protein
MNTTIQDRLTERKSSNMERSILLQQQRIEATGKLEDYLESNRLQKEKLAKIKSKSAEQYIQQLILSRGQKEKNAKEQLQEFLTKDKKLFEQQAENKIKETKDFLDRMKNIAKEQKERRSRILQETIYNMDSSLCDFFHVKPCKFEFLPDSNENLYLKREHCWNTLDLEFPPVKSNIDCDNKLNELQHNCTRFNIPNEYCNSQSKFIDYLSTCKTYEIDPHLEKCDKYIEEYLEKYKPVQTILDNFDLTKHDIESIKNMKNFPLQKQYFEWKNRNIIINIMLVLVFLLGFYFSRRKFYFL